MKPKSKRPAAKRGRRPKPAEIPDLGLAPVVREITIESVIRDLAFIKATLSSML